MSLVKKKRVSKRHKSTWRKTDIKDVEEFLEAQRQEERVGSFETKKDEELFTDDKGPSKAKRLGITGRQRRKLNALKPCRTHEVWNNISKVQDPIVKRNKIKQKKAGRNIEDEMQNPTKPRHVQANKDREKYYESLDKSHKRKTINKFTKNIWANSDIIDTIPGLKDEKGWISKDLSHYIAKHILRQPIVKVHDGLRHRTTKAKNFEPPNPGMSYNPSLTDHQDLIKNVVDREEKIIKEEKHLKRVTTSMFSKVTVEEMEEQKLKEMRSGLDDDDEDNIESKDSPTASDDADNNASYATVNLPVQNKKKTRQQRNKELRHKQLQKRQADKKAIRKQIADLNRIKNIKVEIATEEESQRELMKRRQKTALKKKYETKRLGRLKYVEPDTDVTMVEDLAGNLRNVKPESSLLVDRFKSFQKRNILPTSVATGKQKARKVKRYLRSSHKDPGISFDMLRQQRKTVKTS